MHPLASGKELVFSLVLQVGFSASLAALLVRFARFRRVLFKETRDSDQKVLLLLFLTPPLALGVVLRLVGYRFFDISLAGAFLMGLMGGRIVGLLGGSLLSLPAFGNHEWLSTPLAALVGLLAGLIRQTMPNKEDVWHFGPFLFLNIPKSIWRLARHGQLNWAMLPLGACVLLELGRYALASVMPTRWLYTLAYPDWRWLPLIILATVMCVAMPIKIWNNTRIEMNLEPDQSPFSFQHAEHGLVAGPLRSGYGAHRGTEALEYFAAALAHARNVRAAARRARFHRRLSGYRSRAFRPRQIAIPQGSRRRHARCIRSQHVAAADYRERHTPRARTKGRRRRNPPAHAPGGWPPGHRYPRQRNGNFRRTPHADLQRGHRHQQRSRTPALALWRPVRHGYSKPRRRWHADPHRNSGIIVFRRARPDLNLT